MLTPGRVGSFRPTPASSARHADRPAPPHPHHRLPPTRSAGPSPAAAAWHEGAAGEHGAASTTSVHHATRVPCRFSWEMDPPIKSAGGVRESGMCSGTVSASRSGSRVEPGNWPEEISVPGLDPGPTAVVAGGGVLASLGCLRREFPPLPLRGRALARRLIFRRAFGPSGRGTFGAWRPYRED